MQARVLFPALRLLLPKTLIVADEDVLTLIVEIGALVDIVEIGKQRASVIPVAFRASSST